MLDLKLCLVLPYLLLPRVIEQSQTHYIILNAGTAGLETKDSMYLKVSIMYAKLKAFIG